MQENNNQGTDISTLGEFGLIKHLSKNVKLTQESTLKGIGDDAAVLNQSGKKTVVTTDLLIEGIHFDLMYTPLRHLGYKAIVVNVSDVYAMNAEPKLVVSSVNRLESLSLFFLDDQSYEARGYYLGFRNALRLVLQHCLV